MSSQKFYSVSILTCHNTLLLLYLPVTALLKFCACQIHRQCRATPDGCQVRHRVGGNNTTIRYWKSPQYKVEKFLLYPEGVRNTH